MHTITVNRNSEPNPVVEKSLLFAEKILRLCKDLFLQKEFIVSKQIGRSATSIGANIAEAADELGMSVAEFERRILTVHRYRYNNNRTEKKRCGGDRQ